jgi:nucleoside phosphorylase
MSIPSTRSEVAGLVAIFRTTAPGAVRQQMLDDLLDRLESWSPDERVVALADLGLACLPLGVAGRFPEIETGTVLKPSRGSSDPTHEVDVLIVTVKKPELYAVLHAFDEDPGRDADLFPGRGLRIWLCETPDVRGSMLRVAVCMAGEDGNTRMASFVGSVNRRVSAPLCVLLGMAAGVPDETELGDVVAAQMVVDPAKVRQTPSGPLSRSEHAVPDRTIHRDQLHFDPRKYQWRSTFQKKIAAAQAYEFVDLPDEDLSARTPHFKEGVVVGSGVLVEDDSMHLRLDEVHDKTRAQEMEGYGFACTCEEDERLWLVWRGVADFGRGEVGESGEPGERPRHWQFAATLAAATAFCLFLQFDYRADDDLAL